MDERGGITQRPRPVWALGDYAVVARHFEGAAEDVVAASGMAAGDRVVDLATGNGNAAVLAARLGADVTAMDFAPTLLDQARERAAAEGLRLRLDEADLEALPYPDGAFDVATSVFGLMFAPRPAVATAEAFRVLRPDGVLALSAWTPDGFTGQVTALMGEYLAAPLGAALPIDWGIEAIVRERIGPHADDLRLGRGAVTWEFPSLEEALAWQEANFGALIAVREQLGERRYPELRERFVGLMRDWNRAHDGAVRLPATYLRVVARKRRD